ncbi:MAG: ABC transporter ATP-binding protein/permease [Ruminococcaceae bacterium]|nr:ABC transporter ATP-binding protein/permease [Oscillospiraceae bacterium]
MLSLRSIKKKYVTGDNVVNALDGVSIDFRKSEFVSVLGQSGCGKTTLLNIVGGLDRYTEGDLVIRGKSTKEFTDRDWDNYRNHSVGFVFQSYNLIPHQTALANVELALTLSGVSKSERRKRAINALERVGLSDQLNKRPAQMSGGQAQRVAIARALVNDPEIILADEPTGALDSETSVQIMEILKEISRDKLIIMVTHNPELAEKYSTRIIRLTDGRVVGDSDPYTCSEEKEKKEKKKTKKPSMSFLTALGLSTNNLLTKKARTFLTSFAGSIGIIGIALILSISTGVSNYIHAVQEDTLSAYPVDLKAETVDMSTMINSMMGLREEEGKTKHELDGVYSSPVLYDLVNSLNSMETTKNNLNAFKKYLESKSEFVDKHSTAVEYIYNFDFNVFTKDPNGKIVKSDVLELLTELYGSGMDMMTGSQMMSGMASSSFSAFKVWEQMLPAEAGDKDSLVSPLLKDQYKLVSGDWPKEYNEIVLIVNSSYEVSDFVLFSLGLKSLEEMKADLEKVSKGEQLPVSENSWSFEEIMAKDFRLVLSSDLFSYDSENNKYIDLSEGDAADAGLGLLFNSDKSIKLKISGILCPSGDSVAEMMGGSIGYTSALTDKLAQLTAESELIKAQLDNKDTDVILGLPFKDKAPVLTDGEKIEKAKEYIASLDQSGRAQLYLELSSVMPDALLQQQISQLFDGKTRAELEEMIIGIVTQQMGSGNLDSITAQIKAMDDESFYATLRPLAEKELQKQYAQMVGAQLAAMGEQALSAALDTFAFTDETYLSLYETKVPAGYSDTTYEENLKLLGYVDPDSPDGIRIFSDTFANKEEIAGLIEEYNLAASEEDRIDYTDYAAMMMSGISTIIDAITYVLIAFVSVSLVVSSIMIGIITYISVLERTKEIGILRSIGGSKRDISRVFNAETFIVGVFAGIIGIGATVLMTIPINAIIQHLTGITTLRATLPWEAALVLVALSMALTVIAGFVPSKIAAKKDPVVALRTE